MNIQVVVASDGNKSMKLDVKSKGTILNLKQAYQSLNPNAKDMEIKVFKQGRRIPDKEIIDDKGSYTLSLQLPLYVKYEDQEKQIFVIPKDKCSTIKNYVRNVFPQLKDSGVKLMYKNNELPDSNTIQNELQPLTHLAIQSTKLDPLEKLMSLGFTKQRCEVALLLNQDNLEKAEKDLLNGTIEKVIKEATDPHLKIGQQTMENLALRVYLDPDCLFSVLEDIFQHTDNAQIFYDLPDFVAQNSILKNIKFDYEKIYLQAVYNRYLDEGKHGSLVIPQNDIDWMYRFLIKATECDIKITDIERDFRALVPDLILTERQIIEIEKRANAEGKFNLNDNQDNFDYIEDHHDDSNDENPDEDDETDDTLKTYFTVFIEGYAESGDQHMLDDLEPFFENYDFDIDYLDRLDELLNELEIRTIPIEDLRRIIQNAPEGDIKAAIENYLNTGRNINAGDNCRIM